MDNIPSLPRQRGSIKSLSPEKSAQAFMTTLKESRQAFDIFKTEAEKKGMMGKKIPLLHSQAQYYSKYIKNRNIPNDYSTQFLPPSNINKTSGDTLPDQPGVNSMKTRNRFAQSIDLSSQQQSPLHNSRRKPFVPLKDLLQRNHDDRVREYLDKMKGLSIDDIVNTSILNKASPAKDQRVTPDKSIQGEGMFSGVTSPLGARNEGRSNPASHLSMGGVTQKQVSIVEGARAMVHSLAIQAAGNQKAKNIKLRSQFGQADGIQSGSKVLSDRRQSTRFPEIQNDKEKPPAIRQSIKMVPRKSDMEINTTTTGERSPPGQKIFPFERTKTTKGAEQPSDVASRGERSPKTSQPQAVSDRVSDNDSNASGSGPVGIKKTTKNTAQKNTKPLGKIHEKERIQKLKDQFDIELHPELLKAFDKIVPERRLRNQGQFRQFLEKRYQLPIANQIATIMAPRFHNNFQIAVQPDHYFLTIANFVVQKKEENLKFVFKLFDVFNEDRITEAGLFKFMEDASIRRNDQPSVPTDILGLNETEVDIFLEIFSPTYSKIVEAMAKKQKLKQQQDSFISKGRNFRQQITGPAMGSTAQARDSSINFFVVEQAMAAVRSKGKKTSDRGALGSSMMSASSNEDRDSIARRTTQSRNNSTMANNLTASMDGPSKGFSLMQSAQKKDHRKYDKDKDKDKPSLNESEFINLMADAFPGDRPSIIDDLVQHLTGVQMVSTKQSINEADEYPIEKAQMPKADNDEELAAIKRTFSKVHYQAITQAFQKLWGVAKEDQVPDSVIEQTAVLTEANFTRNIKYVIGVDEPYFGKMLYLWISKGYDRAKITISDFINAFLTFKGDDKQKQLKKCFEILDIDQDRVLNILNLLHLHKYLKPRTLLAREIITVIDEYLSKNIMNNSKRLNRIEVDFESYHKLMTSSCIRNEIRRKFWNISEPFEPEEPSSICEQLQGNQLAHYYTDEQLEDRSFLFESLDYYDDVLPGQRGFGRNMDRLCNQLVQFYHKKFKAHAEQTMVKIETKEKKQRISLFDQPSNEATSAEPQKDTS